MEQQEKKKPSTFLTTIIVIACGVGVWLLVHIVSVGIGVAAGHAAADDINQTQLDSAYKTAFLDSCAKSAVNAGSTTDSASTYCGCVWDDGNSSLGADTFKAEVAKTGTENSISPALQTVVDGCNE